MASNFTLTLRKSSTKIHTKFGHFWTNGQNSDFGTIFGECISDLKHREQWYLVACLLEVLKYSAFEPIFRPAVRTHEKSLLYGGTLETGQFSQFGRLNGEISKAFQVPRVLDWTSFGTWRQGQCVSGTLFFCYKNLGSVWGKLITSSTPCFCTILFLAPVCKTCI